MVIGDRILIHFERIRYLRDKEYAVSANVNGLPPDDMRITLVVVEWILYFEVHLI